MHLKEINAEVLYVDGPCVKIDATVIAELKYRAARNRRGRIRICAHPDVDDRLHEMLIVHQKDAYVRPHRHPQKSESFHVIEGEADVLLFTDEGRIREVIPLGPLDGGKNFYYRISASIYHSICIHTEFFIFHETTNGPFNPADTIFAPWAPPDNPPDAQVQYLAQLKDTLRRTNV